MDVSPYFLLIALMDWLCRQVGQKKWKVDTNSRMDSVLMLSAVNLPGNVLVCVRGRQTI